MRKEKLQAATLGGTADEVEAAFYEALAKGDLERLVACWADEDDIVCIHPGGGRLVGIGAIRASFEALFANSAINATPLSVRKVESLASSMHNVIERIELKTPEGLRHGYVIATNVYLKTAQGWRMAVHHASPGTIDEARLAEAPAQMLH
ncbi:MAG: nuclear transport factor 2 family protein [Burkholderiales bacterium]